MLNNIFNERINGKLGFSETKRHKLLLGRGPTGTLSQFVSLKISLYLSKSIPGFHKIKNIQVKNEKFVFLAV